MCASRLRRRSRGSLPCSSSTPSLRSRQGATGAGGKSVTDPRPFACRRPFLRRSEPRRPTCPHLQAASPRAEDEVQRPKHLARTFYGVRMRGRRLRSGASARLGEDASQGPGARRPGQPRAFAYRGRDAGVGRGRAAASRQEVARAEKAVVVVGWSRRRRTGSRPSLARLHIRRFDLEHTFRFLKQTLGWTTPRVRHPEQADRWTWLAVAAFTQSSGWHG